MLPNPLRPRPPAWRKWAERDRSWSQLCFRARARPALVRMLLAVSWLSNGKFWYALIALLPLFADGRGFACALRMLLLGGVNLAVYLIVKHHLARPRPFVDCQGVRARTRALDEFSFPSGHVLHAVGFSTLLVAYFPHLAWVLWPFVLLVALSRVMLGLHYPSDVAVGALIGWIMAHTVLLLL